MEALAVKTSRLDGECGLEVLIFSSDIGRTFNKRKLGNFLVLPNLNDHCGWGKAPRPSWKTFSCHGEWCITI